jgi:hypothetical protein
MAPEGTTSTVVVKLRGGPRPMSAVVKGGQANAADEHTASFGPDDIVRFSGIPPGRARVEISRHAMPPLLALRTLELKGGETAEIEVVLDTLVDLSGLVVRTRIDKLPLEAVAIFKNGKSQSSTLSADGSFRFRDVPQGPCTVEVRTFDAAQKVLWSQLLNEIPAARLDIEVDTDVQVEPAPRPQVEKAPLPPAPKISVAAPPAPKPSPKRAPAPSMQVAAAAPVPPAPKPSPKRAPAPPMEAAAAPPPPAPKASPKQPVAAAPVVAAPPPAPAPVVEAAPAPAPAAKKGKKEAAAKKEAAPKKAPAAKKEPAAKKAAAPKKEAAPKKAAAPKAEKKPAAKKKK